MRLYFIYPLVFIFIVFMIIGNCSRIEKPTAVDNSNPEILSSLTAQEVEDNLREFSKTLAITVESPELLEMLKSEIGRKFEGQFEILYRHVADKTLSSNTTLKKKLGNARKVILQKQAMS